MSRITRTRLRRGLKAVATPIDRPSRARDERSIVFPPLLLPHVRRGGARSIKRAGSAWACIGHRLNDCIYNVPRLTRGPVVYVRVWIG